MMSMQQSNIPLYVLETKMLTYEKLDHQGELDFQDSGRRICQGWRGGIQELCILSILNLITDIKIKYNENIVGDIISHKNHVNRQLFCAQCVT